MRRTMGNVILARWGLGLAFSVLACFYSRDALKGVTFTILIGDVCDFPQDENDWVFRQCL